MLLDGESEVTDSAPALPRRWRSRARWMPDAMRTRERKRTVGPAGWCRPPSLSASPASSSPSRSRAGLRLMVILLLPNDDGLGSGPSPLSNCRPRAFSGKMGDLETEN
jgi:hypothetical protein